MLWSTLTSCSPANAHSPQWLLEGDACTYPIETGNVAFPFLRSLRSLPARYDAKKVRREHFPPQSLLRNFPLRFTFYVLVYHVSRLMSYHVSFPLLANHISYGLLVMATAVRRYRKNRGEGCATE
jgi:hypothetical protein